MAFLIAGMSIKHVLGLPVDFGLEFGQVVKCFIPPVDVIVRKWVETWEPEVNHFFLGWFRCVSDAELALELVGWEGHDEVGVFGADEETEEETVVCEIGRSVSIFLWFVVDDDDTFDKSLFGELCFFPVVTCSFLPINEQESIRIGAISLREDIFSREGGTSVPRESFNNPNLHHF